MLQVTDPALFRPVAAYLTLIALAREQAPEAFAFRAEPYEFETDMPAFDLFTGSAEARAALESGASPGEVVALVSPVDSIWKEVVYDAEERMTAPNVIARRES